MKPQHLVLIAAVAMVCMLAWAFLHPEIVRTEYRQKDEKKSKKKKKDKKKQKDVLAPETTPAVDPVVAAPIVKAADSTADSR